MGRSTRELRPDTANAVFDSRVLSKHQVSPFFCVLVKHQQNAVFTVDVFVSITIKMRSSPHLILKNEKESQQPSHLSLLRQATLIFNRGEFLLRDSGSSNGSFINNFRLSKPGEQSLATKIYSKDILR